MQKSQIKTKKQVSINLSLQTYQFIVDKAEIDHRSFSSYLDAMIWKALKEENAKKSEREKYLEIENTPKFSEGINEEANI